MVLGSPCSQELAAGAGSSRRRPRVVQAALRGEAVQAVRLAPRQPFSRLASVLRSPHAAALIAAARTLEFRFPEFVGLDVQE